MRRFSSVGACRARALATPKKLRLRPPVAASSAHLQLSDEHPLWQFFNADKHFLSLPASLDKIGNPWSVPQLRRKSVEDLNVLWYVCLRELNRLNREDRIVRSWKSTPTADTDTSEVSSVFKTPISGIKTTMWRIRHVLSERYHGFRSAEIELSSAYPALLAEFSSEYLSADAGRDAEVTEQLERFQFAFFGINPLLEENIPSDLLVRGLYEVTKLKLQRYSSPETKITSVDDIREAFLLFSCEHSPEGVTNAAATIAEMRAQGQRLEKDEVETLAELMHTASTCT